MIEAEYRAVWRQEIEVGVAAGKLTVTDNNCADIRTSALQASDDDVAPSEHAS